jgi:hypothetical protein
MSWDNDVWARMIKNSIEMASNQVKRNIELASEMASNQVKRNIEMASEMARALTMTTGTLGKETDVAIEKASREMMASAERLGAK